MFRLSLAVCRFGASKNAYHKKYLSISRELLPRTVQYVPTLDEVIWGKYNSWNGHAAKEIKHWRLMIECIWVDYLHCFIHVLRSVFFWRNMKLRLHCCGNPCKTSLQNVKVEWKLPNVSTCKKYGQTIERRNHRCLNKLTPNLIYATAREDTM